MTKPSRECIELVQFFVGMAENPVRQKVETVECLYNSVQLGRVKSENIA